MHVRTKAALQVAFSKGVYTVAADNVLVAGAEQTVEVRNHGGCVSDQIIVCALYVFCIRQPSFLWPMQALIRQQHVLLHVFAGDPQYIGNNTSRCCHIPYVWLLRSPAAQET